MDLERVRKAISAAAEAGSSRICEELETKEEQIAAAHLVLPSLCHFTDTIMRAVPPAVLIVCLRVMADVLDISIQEANRLKGES